MPASQSATNTVIQSRATSKSFTMYKKQLGFFLERWLKRHALPILTKLLTPQEIIAITGSVDELQTYDEAILNNLAYDKIDKDSKKGIYYTPEQVMAELEKSKEKLRKTGKDRFVKLAGKVDFTKYDVRISVTNEEIDTEVLAQNLLTTLKLAPQYQDAVVKYLFDLMGLDTFQLEEAKTRMMNKGINPNMPPVPGKVSTSNQQQLVTNANLPV
jgi:hypothetical protein